MAQVSIARVEKVEKALATSRRKLREGARLGANSLITGVVGGVASGWVQAKYPTVLNTSVNTSGAVGTGLVLLALSGVLDEYSDEAAALGSGMLACAISRESEKYFSD